MIEFHEQKEKGHSVTKANLSSVSVVVPTHNRNRDLERCLDAVSRLDPPADEVIVVDSAPQGEGARALCAKWRVRYVREDRPGASRARNRGAREAGCEIVAFTDDDAAPDPGWLGNLRPEFKDPRVALVAGMVIAPAMNSHLSRLYELCGFTGQGEDRLALDAQTPQWFEQVNFLPFGLAFNLAIRRSVFQSWSGFDERIGVGTSLPGNEEQRAFLDLIDLGFRLVYAPAARVCHPLVEKTKEELRLRSLLRIKASAAYLTLLMVEEPRHRKEVLAYVMRKLGGRFHHRQAQNGVSTPVLPRLWARLQGPGIYLRSRRGHQA